MNPHTSPPPALMSNMFKNKSLRIFFFCYFIWDAGSIFRQHVLLSSSSYLLYQLSDFGYDKMRRTIIRLKSISFSGHLTEEMSPLKNYYQIWNCIPTQLHFTVSRKILVEEYLLFLLTRILNCSAVWLIKDLKWNIRSFLTCEHKGKLNPRFSY